MYLFETYEKLRLLVCKIVSMAGERAPKGRPMRSQRHAALATKTMYHVHRAWLVVRFINSENLGLFEA